MSFLQNFIEHTMSFERYVIPLLLDQRPYDRSIEICTNYNLTLDIIEKHPEIRWKGYHLSENPNITWDFVEKHPEIEWSYGSLDNGTHYYNYSDSNKYPVYKYSFNGCGGLSLHPNINFDIIFAHPEKPWQNHWLHFNPNLTWDIVVEHPEIEWSSCYLFQNPALNRIPNESDGYVLK